MIGVTHSRLSAPIDQVSNLSVNIRNCSAEDTLCGN